MSWLLPIQSLVLREFLRFGRQRSRMVASLGTPIVLWLLIGFGLQAAFPGVGRDRAGFLEHFFPANLVLTVLFSAIFSNISTIQDRKEGFLQGVLVAPVSGVSLVMGKVLGGAVIAWIQGMLFLALAPLVGMSLSFTSVILISGILFLTAIVLTALGFLFAWWFDSVQGFHGVMNLILMPMWLLSGAFFPMESAPWILKTVMKVNPLTSSISGVRSALQHPELMTWGPAIVLLAYALSFVLVGGTMVSRRRYQEAN